ncbi:formylglycine-generating enzyme family protein [Marilutibacter maris]|uniref:SUMF1/EgtB/PvdO family nonheme iron enzyme n=1 Tax=Marilutibacter maris TaxID=1605891 RepID=A0A2U9T7A1_9GAMM|nr:formylglycine-generating enzyme family protein [Lysobacter maris]AWV06378.1 signal peptide protein [Lysobacter maris]KAB8161868.1 SUMF1/EgtB/PvdO family nonheme iron enzyme [Lysobacter maris]
MRTAWLLALLLPFAAAAGDGRYVSVPAGTIRSALAYEDIVDAVEVAPFAMRERPVTNAEFLAFVAANPQWRRDRAAKALVDERYLGHWQGPLTPGEARGGQPATQVSWFAAAAYCASESARLPTWSEWEYVAAADETRRDARRDPAWRERILAWYSRPSDSALPRVGLQAPNAYGVQDIHGLVWEWTEDFSSLLVSSDNRNQGDPDNTRFCGAGALSMRDRDNYAVLMRVAMLSSLSARSTTANLGFRCVRSLP